MVKRSSLVSFASAAAVLTALLGRAVTVHSIGAVPVIYRAIANDNDLDSVEGLAPPGRLVELWYRQRNFREGDAGTTDPFGWCAWKHGGVAVYLGTTWSDANGVWRFQNLQGSGNTVMLFPAAAGGCESGIYTELLPRACDAPGINCTMWATPKLGYLNVRKETPIIGVAVATVTGAEQASLAVADGPDDGPGPSDVSDVDQNAVDTTVPGYAVGQRITWKCGAGGTATCPSVTVHDASTAVSTDAEYPFVLGTMQAHRAGGSFIAAAAVVRGTPIGFAVNVNVKLRARADVNLGCDSPKPFNFLPFQFPSGA
jgi:hypothetical protein